MSATEHPRRGVRDLIRLGSGERQMFVIVNVAVNLVLLGRSYVTMQVLDYRDLGLAALLQTVILLLGMLQFGFLNGGYRLLCSAEEGERRRINDLVYTFLGVALVGGGVIALVIALLAESMEARLVILLGFVGGAATLGRTWISNQMVARHALKRINRINLLSGSASVATLAFIPLNPLLACLSAVVVQPIVFVLAAMVADRTLMPGRLLFSVALTRAVMQAGFIMFLTGLFVQLNLQIERWYVVAFLGLDALGHLYLAAMFVTLFQMVPTSLDQIYLPPLVRAYRDGDFESVRRGMRQFFLVTSGYCAAVGVVLVLFAHPVTALLLPGYVGDLRYVYLLAPGLVLFTLASPFAILFNVLIRYRYYFIAFGAGTMATVLAFAAAALTHGRLDLDGVTLVRSGGYVLIALILIGGFVAMTRDLPAFRFNPLRVLGRLR